MVKENEIKLNRFLWLFIYTKFINVLRLESFCVILHRENITDVMKPYGFLIRCTYKKRANERIKLKRQKTVRPFIF